MIPGGGGLFFVSRIVTKKSKKQQNRPENNKKQPASHRFYLEAAFSVYIAKQNFTLSVNTNTQARSQPQCLQYICLITSPGIFWRLR